MILKRLKRSKINILKIILKEKDDKKKKEHLQFYTFLLSNFITFFLQCVYIRLNVITFTCNILFYSMHN